MESFASPVKVYKFDELFFDIFKSNLLRRPSPGSPLAVCRSKTMFVALGILVIITIDLVLKLAEIFRSSEIDFNEISAICEVGSAFLMAFGRGSTLLLNHATINGMLTTLEKLFPVTRRDQARFQIESFAKRIIYYNKAMKVLINMSVIGYSSIAFVQSLFGVIVMGEPYVFRYPFICWYPFDENSFVLYPLIYAFHISAGVSTAIFYFYEEFMFTSCVLQVCMHYHHLCERLRAVDATRVSNIGADIGPHIRYHYILEELQDQINDSFSRSTFFGFTIIKIAICMFFFSTVSGQGLFEDLPLFVCVITLVVPVYLRCKATTDLWVANEGILTSIYDQNWYEGSIAYRKAVATMMIKANRPKALRASQLRQISMEYFKEIMVDTYQVFMFFFNSSQ